MSEVKRYDMCGFGGGLVESKEGAWYHFEDFDRVTAERDALQQRLTAADERVDVLEGLLFEYRNYRQATLQEMADLRDRADAALNPTAEGCVHEFIPFTEGCSKCGEPYTAEGKP